MAKKKTEEKKIEVEREYVIPLRDKCRVVPRYKKTPKAVKTIKEFVARHMKVYDRDLNKIKLDISLNEFLWNRGIKNPVHKIRVKVVKEGENIRVNLVDIPDKIKFKLAKVEKIEKAADEVAKKKKSEKVAPEGVPPKADEGVKEKSEEEIKEEGEKKAAVVEAGVEMEKAAAKQMKHVEGGKNKEPKRQQRMALQK